MPNLLFAWELGGHLGHLMRFRALAGPLTRNGFKLSLALRDLSRAQTLFSDQAYDLYQAPLWLPRAPFAPRPPRSYAEILHYHGYLSEEGLHGVVRGWRTLFKAARPDLVLFDHAPTALLSARGLPFAKAIIGTGFFTPPPVHPLPAFNASPFISKEHLLASENRVVKTINRVLRDLGQPELKALYELFEVNENFLCTLQELDHYRRATQPTYWGPVMGSGEARPAAWSETGAPKVFAYLKPQHSATVQILAGIKAAGLEALIYAPDIAEDTVKEFADSRVVFSRTPYDIDSVVKACDLVICHAGHDTLAAALLAGKPVLLGPTQVEQLILARRVESAGLGLVIARNASASRINEQIACLLERGPRVKAMEFSARYRSYAGRQPVERIVDRCLGLVNSLS